MTPTNERWLQFTCPQCTARLKAPLAAAGSRHRCPRCQLVFEVPRQTRMTPRGEGYPLHQETESSLADGCHAAEEALIRVVCPRCHTMMYATLDQVGGKLVCPDCQTPTVVPPPPPPRRKIDVMAGAGEGYALAGSDKTSPRKSVPPPPPPPPPAADEGISQNVAQPPSAVLDRSAQPRAAVPHAGWPRTPPPPERQFKPDVGRPILPRWPFLAGTFSFPLSRGVRARVLLLAAWTVTCVALAWESVQLGAITGLPTWFGSAMLGAVAVILMVMWFALAAACALAVVRETANGCDEIQDWPSMAFIDWIAEPLYVFDSVCVSLLPGVGLAWLLASYGQPSDAAAPAVAFLLFPIVLLSMLESGSPLGAVSWPVYQTFWRAWKGWAAFYLASAALLVAAGAVVTAVRSVGQIWQVVVVALTEAAVWFIYFRLLGRLAWYCTDRAARAEPETEPDADETTSEDNST